MFNDDHPHLATGFFFSPDGFAFDDVFKANFTGDFRKNGDRVRVPFAKRFTWFDLLAIFHQQHRTGGDGIAFKFTTAIIDQGDFAVTSQDDQATFSVFNRSNSRQANFTGLLALDVRFLHGFTDRTTDVEGPHGQLSTGFTDRLSRDDPNGHAFFDHGTG